MHLGIRGRAALVGVGVLTAVIAVLGVAKSEYGVAGIALLVGVASGLSLLIWGLTSTLGRAVAELGLTVGRLQKQVSVLEKQGTRNLERQRRNEQLHQRTHQHVETYSARLEQLAMQVSFPALQGKAPGDAISTRFADYLDQPMVREGSRVEALLEQLARETTERKAFEDFVRVHLAAEAPQNDS